MLIYIFILLILIIGISIKNEKVKNVYEKIVIIILILIVGLRSVGTDFFAYKYYYLNINSDVCKRLDIGCKALMRLSYYLFNEKFQCFFVLVSTITIVLIYSTIKKHSKNSFYSIVLFVLLGFYAKSFNIMKQYLAISISFFGLRYIIDKKLWKYLLTICIAATIHQTAFIMIPFYWIANMKISKKRFIEVFSLATVMLMFFDKVFNIFTSIEQYKLYNEYTTGIDAGIGTVLNIIFFVIILVLCMVRYKSLAEVDENNKKYMNIALFSIPFLFVSLKNVLFYRISLYFLIYLILILPNIFKNIKQRNRLLLDFVLLLGLVLYYFASVYYFGGIYPYKSSIF